MQIIFSTKPLTGIRPNPPCPVSQKLALGFSPYFVGTVLDKPKKAETTIITGFFVG
jgi:hypothetical protein